MQPRITDFRWVVADRHSGTNRSASKCYMKKVCNDVFFLGCTEIYLLMHF